MDVWELKKPLGPMDPRSMFPWLNSIPSSLFFRNKLFAFGFWNLAISDKPNSSALLCKWKSLDGHKWLKLIDIPVSKVWPCAVNTPIEKINPVKNRFMYLFYVVNPTTLVYSSIWGYLDSLVFFKTLNKALCPVACNSKIYKPVSPGMFSLNAFVLLNDSFITSCPKAFRIITDTSL